MRSIPLPLALYSLLALGLIACTGSLILDDDVADDDGAFDDDASSADDDASATPTNNPTPTPLPTPTIPPPTPTSPPTWLSCGPSPTPLSGGNTETYTGEGSFTMDWSGSGSYLGCELLTVEQNGQMACQTRWELAGPITNFDWGGQAATFDLTFTVTDDTCGTGADYQQFYRATATDQALTVYTIEFSNDGQNWTLLTNNGSGTFDWATFSGTLTYKAVF